MRSSEETAQTSPEAKVPALEGEGGGDTRLSTTVLRAKYERFEKHRLVFLKLLNFKSDLFQSPTTLFYNFRECQCHYLKRKTKQKQSCKSALFAKFASSGYTTF